MIFNVTLFLKYGYRLPLISREVFLIPTESESMEEINLIGIKEQAIAMLRERVESLPLIYECDEIIVSRPRP